LSSSSSEDEDESDGNSVSPTAGMKDERALINAGVRPTVSRVDPSVLDGSGVAADKHGDPSSSSSLAAAVATASKAAPSIDKGRTIPNVAALSKAILSSSSSEDEDESDGSSVPPIAMTANIPRLIDFIALQPGVETYTVDGPVKNGSMHHYVEDSNWNLPLLSSYVLKHSGPQFHFVPTASVAPVESSDSDSSIEEESVSGSDSVTVQEPIGSRGPGMRGRGQPSGDSSSGDESTDDSSL